MKVNNEWTLIAAKHNLLKLFRLVRSQQQAQAAETGWGAVALARAARVECSPPQ
jgi:hypothetical protein